MTIAVSFIHRFQNTFSNNVGCVNSMCNGLIWWSWYAYCVCMYLKCCYAAQWTQMSTLSNIVYPQLSRTLAHSRSCSFVCQLSSPKPLTIIPPCLPPYYGSTTAQLKSNDRQFQLNVAANVHILQLLWRIKYQSCLVCIAFRVVELSTKYYAFHRHGTLGVRSIEIDSCADNSSLLPFFIICVCLFVALVLMLLQT